MVAGLRAAGHGEENAGALCDEVAVDAPITDLLSVVDDVHVMTSLAGFEAFLQTSPGWNDFPRVVDGASSLFLAALGPDAGAHARALFGVERLPRDYALELTATFALDG